MTQDEAHIGDQVGYRDINLQGYRGVIVRLGRPPHGGECVVQWHRPLDVRGDACLAHLRKSAMQN
jgi:hypothetical protein